MFVFKFYRCRTIIKKFMSYLDKVSLHIFGTRFRWNRHNRSVFLGYLDQQRGIHGFGWFRHFRRSQDMRPIRSTGPKHRRLKTCLSVKAVIRTKKSSEIFIDQIENYGNNENSGYLVSRMSRRYSLVRLRFDQHRKRFHHRIHKFQLP